MSDITEWPVDLLITSLIKSNDYLHTTTLETLNDKNPNDPLMCRQWSETVCDDVNGLFTRNLF